MKHIILCMTAFIMLLASCTSTGDANEAVTDNASSSLFPYPIHQYQMENGLNVVTVEYPSEGLAAFYIVVRVGSREEVEEGKTGFAHFFEHMMFRGTDNYSKEEYSEVLKSIGAAANANTWLDRTVYHMTGNSAMLEKMFEVEADRFMNLNYSVHDFKTEAGAVKGEYTKNYSNPYQQLQEKLVGTAFTNHTYEHTTMGFWEDVVDMPNQYDYSLEFFDRFYRPEYSTILVVGDVTSEEVNALSEKYFGMWERGSYEPEIPQEPTQTATRYAHIQNANFPPYLSLNYKSPGFSNETVDIAALDIIATLLFSERSDLYKKLVIEEQKLRSLRGGAYYTRDPFLFMINSSLVDADDLAYVKDEIEKALEDLKNNPVDPELLADTKSNLKYSFSMSLDNPTSIAEVLSYAIWVSGDPEAFNKLYAQYEQVTQEEIMQVARKYFVPEKLTIATISPKAEGGLK